MPAYVTNCKNCTRRLEVNWEGDHRLLPTAATCPQCGYADGYGEDELLLVGAFQVECPVCEDTSNAEVPARFVDYSAPTGLKADVTITCKQCGATSVFQPQDITWLGAGPSMPEASPLGVGQQRP